MNATSPADDRAVDDPAVDHRAAEALATDVRIALMRAVRRLRAEKADDDLSDAQYSVLAYLDRTGPATPGALAEFERVRPPTMTRTLSALADLGLVERSAHPGDRRQVLVRLTEPGRRTVEDTRVQRNAWLARHLAALTPDERAALVSSAVILRRIADS